MWQLSAVDNVLKDKVADAERRGLMDYAYDGHLSSQYI